MRATLYTMDVSHPGHAARLMLAHKRVATAVVELRAGLHPLALWLRGFRAGTVPAARLDGRRVEGSTAIAQALEQALPEPPLYPAGRTAAVAEAERWGDEVFQNMPRRVVRYAIAHDLALRRGFNRDHSRLPAPAVAAVLSAPVARALAARVGASEAGAREALAQLPEALDHVDALLADGTLGAGGLTAADAQIAPTVRLVSAVADLAPLADGRPCERWARSLVPRFPALPPSRALAALAAG